MTDNTNHHGKISLMTSSDKTNNNDDNNSNIISLLDCAKKLHENARVVKERAYEEYKRAEKEHKESWFYLQSIKRQLEEEDESSSNKKRKAETTAPHNNIDTPTSTAAAATTTTIDTAATDTTDITATDTDTDTTSTSYSCDIEQCPVCLEEFQYDTTTATATTTTDGVIDTTTTRLPVTGLCGHSVCKPCLISIHLERLEGRHRIRYLKCPCCNDKENKSFDANNFSPNIAMCNMISKMMEEKKKKMLATKLSLLTQQQENIKDGHEKVGTLITNFFVWNDEYRNDPSGNDPKYYFYPRERNNLFTILPPYKDISLESRLESRGCIYFWNEKEYCISGVNLKDAEIQLLPSNECRLVFKMGIIKNFYMQGFRSNS